MGVREGGGRRRPWQEDTDGEEVVRRRRRTRRSMRTREAIRVSLVLCNAPIVLDRKEKERERGILKCERSSLSFIVQNLVRSITPSYTGAEVRAAGECFGHFLPAERGASVYDVRTRARGGSLKANNGIDKLRGWDNDKGGGGANFWRTS